MLTRLSQVTKVETQTVALCRHVLHGGINVETQTVALCRQGFEGGH